ncbi:MAG: ComEC/Rec2 family competence protein [Candidatus Omnitrophica bacterium]|nr:ComEC/Rec2 family competence protein [Candidatus Omnitrophota bacterium]
MNPRRPFLSMVIFLSFGILVGEYINISFYILSFFCLIGFSLSYIFLKQTKVSLIFIFASLFLLGAALVQSAKSIGPDDISSIVRFYRKDSVTIEGIVVSDVQEKDFHATKKLSFELDVKRIKSPWGWKKKSGRILVHVFGERDIAFGDYLKMEGKIYPAFNFKTENRFSYKEYLLRKKIRCILSVKKALPVDVIRRNQGNFLKAFSLRLKKKLSGILDANFTSNQSGIMHAILLGDRQNIPVHIRELFIQTGTAHILAISGLHIGIVAFLIFLALKIIPLKRKWRYILTAAFLIFYCFLIGSRPSVVRATIMASIFLFSFVSERESDPINALCLAGFAILIMNPLYLFDAGFQLSFVSVFSILCLYPVFSKSSWMLEKLSKRRVAKFFVESLFVSLIVWIGVFGLVGYYFEIVTPITILANLFVIPCISVVIALGLSLMFTGVFVPGLNIFFAYCIKVVLSVMVAGIYLMSQIPGAYFEHFSFSFGVVVAYYMVFFGLCFFRILRENKHPRKIDKIIQL